MLIRALLLAAALALAAPGVAAVPTVPATQDWTGDAIAQAGRDLGLARPVTDRLVARAQAAIADGALPCQDGYHRLQAIGAAEPGSATARADARALFGDLRKLIEIRDRSRAETYGSLPPRDQARALVYAEEQARRSRKGPAGMEGAFAYVERGDNLRGLLGCDSRRVSVLKVRVRAFAADRRAVNERRDAAFEALRAATQPDAGDEDLAPALSRWQETDRATTRLDQAELAEIERTLTPAERQHLAGELLPMIDRGMHLAGFYFKVRGAFNRRDIK